MSPVKNVLFVCTGNCCRSVMAETYFRHFAAMKGRNFSVESAGIRATEGMKATPETLQLLQVRGLNAGSHQARRLTVEMLERADLIIGMEEKHRTSVLKVLPGAGEKMILLGQYCPESCGLDPLDGIPDPIGMSPSFYLNVEEIIYKACQALMEQLLPEAEPAPLAASFYSPA